MYKHFRFQSILQHRLSLQVIRVNLGCIIPKLGRNIVDEGDVLTDNEKVTRLRPSTSETGVRDLKRDCSLGT